MLIMSMVVSMTARFARNVRIVEHHERSRCRKELANWIKRLLSPPVGASQRRHCELGGFDRASSLAGASATKRLQREDRS